MNHSTQEILNYKKIFPDGTTHVEGKKYSRMIRFSDISYQLSQDEMKQKIFSQYSTLLNTFDTSVDLQLCFINYRMHEEIIEDDLIEYNKAFSDFEKLRNEYYSFLREQRKKGNNGIIRHKFLVFSVEDSNYKNAVRRLNTIEANIKNHFKKMGVFTDNVDGIDRLSIINYLLNGGEEHYLPIDEIPPNVIKQTPTKDLIAPRTAYFPDNDTTAVINQKKMSTLFLKIEGTELNDRILADFLELEMEMLVSMHIKPLAQEKAVKMVRTKRTDLKTVKIEEQKKAIRNNYDMDLLPGDLNDSIQDSEDLLNDLQRENEKYFYVTFTITVFEKNKEELDNNIYTLSTMAQKQNCRLIPMKDQQEIAFVSALPFANNLNEKEIERGLTTSSTAIFVPFTTIELYQEDNTPVYYGLNALSNNMIQASRKNLKNPNGLILGVPGGGKTFAAKREIIDTFFRTKDDILISDPEEEYVTFTRLLNGTVIKIANNTKNYINPLDITLQYGEGDNPVVFKSDFILNMMELIAGGKDGLSPREKSIIDRCIHTIYRPYLDNPKKENIPILEDLYQELINTGSEEGKNLSDALELYVTGSLNVFNHRTNIDIDNRLVCFNLRQLGSQLKQLGMLILQDFVWNRVTTNRNADKKTWYYLDEIHKNLESEQTASYTVEFWKRFRKWGGIPTGITQNVGDFLKSPQIKTILSNSEFIYLLNQADSDLEILQKNLKFSDYQAEYITNSDEGEGLLIYSGIIIPFKDKFPKNNSLYPVMTSKPEEIQYYKEKGLIELET